MFIDMHMHEMTCSKDSFLKLDQIVSIAREKGLGAVCITDHDSMGLRDYAAEYSRKVDFPIFVGIEFFSLQGDIVAFGIEDYPRERVSAQEFIDLVKKLRKTLPPERIFNWSCNAGIWLTFVLNAGGCVVERQGGKATVRLDDPRTREGLRRALELCRTLGSPMLSMKRGSYQQEFFSGRNAMVLIPREEVNFDSPLPWKSVPVPLIPGGSGLTTQATDLLCVRRHVGDLELVRRVIRQFLSPELQEHLGQLRYGIPIRKSAAIRSFDGEDHRDLVFLTEMTRLSADFNLDSPELSEMVSTGINQIWEGGDIETVTSELATALRTVFRYQKTS